MGSGALDLDVADAARLLERPQLTLRRVLTGGTHARTVVAGDRSGDVVVRRFPPGDPAGRHEVIVAVRLEDLGGLAPRLLAMKEDEVAGDLLVAELVDGGPLGAIADERLASELALAMARIHSLDGSGLRPAPTGPSAGESAIALLARQHFDHLDQGTRVLTHYDLWTGNTLWRGERLVGVVDWSGARSAPRGVDLAWLRLDLVLQGRLAAADLLVEHYRDATGLEIADLPAWDVQAAAQAVEVVTTWSSNYLGVGLADLDAAVLRARMDAWADRLLSALD